jgi:hypothetical protein
VCDPAAFISAVHSLTKSTFYGVTTIKDMGDAARTGTVLVFEQMFYAREVLLNHTPAGLKTAAYLVIQSHASWVSVSLIVTTLYHGTPLQVTGARQWLVLVRG